MARASTSGNAAYLPKGRKKGSKNKITSDLREAIKQSLEHRGGVVYLNGLDDQTFCRLLARVIPQVVSGDFTFDMGEALNGVIERLKNSGKL